MTIHDDNALQFYPLLPPAIALAVGITLSRVMPQATFSVAFIILVLLTVVTLIAHLLCRQWRRAITSLLTMAAFATLGFCLLRDADRKMSFIPLEEPVECDAVVVSDISERERTAVCDILITDGTMNGCRVRVTLQKDSVEEIWRRLAPGSAVRVRTRFRSLRDIPSHSFDFEAYLRARGITATAFLPNGSLQLTGTGMRKLSSVEKVKVRLLRLRRDLLQHHVAGGADADAVAVMAALTLGEKGALRKELREAYAAAGVSHTLALSGMHLGIVYMFLMVLMGGRRNSVVREGILLTLIWAYVLLVGMPFPAVRAGIMLTVLSLSALCGRDRMSLNALAFAAILMLCSNPYRLFDAGFQLSFAAVAGIMMVVRSRRRAASLKDRLWRTVVVIMAAQLATAPLVAAHFGRLPLYFFLSGVLAVPLVTVIVTISFVSLFLSFLPFGGHCEALATLFWGVAEHLTALLNALVWWVATLPGATIDVTRPNSLQVFFIYICMVVLVCLIVKVRKIAARRHFYSAVTSL